MMTDLVERLCADPGPVDTVTELIRIMVEQRREAADEIRRLQRKLDECFIAMEGWRGALAHRDAEIERLQAMNKRLKS